ncbi:MAG: methyltransferase [Anaerolineaceae bacterium 4572_32.2]|nr:MAG: methyltransferase [Anaerolineaceae bacterium 4572_32.2]HEY74526.1 cobalamin-binding protein [Thermoflexia bacterium]
MSQVLTQLQEAVIKGLPDQAQELATQALGDDVAPLTAIDKALNPAMQIVGDKYESGEYFIPDLVMAAEAMKGAMAVIEPVLIERQEKRQVLGTVVIGTVEGDIHEIGKSLVGTMLSASGFQVHDMGVDVPASKFVERVKETGANVVGLSALLTTTMRNQETVIEALQEAGLREQVKVIIGGAPTSPDWAQTIGADGYAENANETVGIVRQLLGV